MDARRSPIHSRNSREDFIPKNFSKHLETNQIQNKHVSEWGNYSRQHNSDGYFTQFTPGSFPVITNSLIGNHKKYFMLQWLHYALKMVSADRSVQGILLLNYFR